MRIKWDLDELYDFGEQLKDFSRFEAHAQRIVKDISKELLKHLKNLTPVGETGELIKGWDGNYFAVTKVDDGYEVLLVNTTPYASDVNDGHMSYNQFGGPYKVHDSRRVKVPTPYKWQRGNKTYYVYGHFFVERSIIQLAETKKIEAIILREIQRWWEGCF